MSRTDPGVYRYTAYWGGHGETVQAGVGMLFAALRRGWPWVHRVGGDLHVIHHRPTTKDK
jgi:hypothetical protein